MDNSRRVGICRVTGLLITVFIAGLVMGCDPECQIIDKDKPSFEYRHIPECQEKVIND